MVKKKKTTTSSKANAKKLRTQTKKVLKKTTSKKKTTKAKVRKRAPLAAARVRQLAIEYETMAEAESQLKKQLSLSDVLSEHTRLQDAWDRGRFLRGLKGLAVTGTTISEAEMSLGMASGELDVLLHTDPEVMDLWNQARLQTTIELKKALLEAAKEGKSRAVAYIEQSLRREIAHPQKDLDRLSIDEMVEITGKTRQGVHKWFLKYNLPRNADATYNLKVFLKWFEEFTVGKIAAGKVVPATNAFQTAKAKQINMAMAKERGDTLNRSEVVTGLIARHQVFMNEFVNKIPTMSLSCVGQPQNKIDKILTERATRILEQLCTVPTQLRLDSDLEEKLIEILSAIKPEGSESENTNNKPA